MSDTRQASDSTAPVAVTTVDNEPNRLADPKRDEGRRSMTLPPQAGQVWTYRTRQGEEQSRLQVLVAETDPERGEVVHVRVGDVRVANPAAARGSATWIGHVPMNREAFDRSVLNLVDTTADSPDLEGYEVWRDEGGGVFTEPLAQILSYIEEALREGQ